MIRILLLEDNKHDAELLRATLEAERGLEFDLKQVATEPEFLDALGSWEPDLIISDYSLPEYSGKSALLTAQSTTPWIPFLFYSGTIGEESAIESLKLGAADYVLKDRPRRLGAAINRALEDARRGIEKTRADEKIKAQAQLIDLATDAIIVRDLEDQIELWNRGAERIYGMDRSEAVGRKITEFLAPESRPVFDEAKRRVLESGQWEGELEHISKDQRKIVLMSRWTLVRTEDGSPHRILAIKTDITEKKSLEKQFLRAQRLESIGTLASGIAHDLNNVLSPILMASELIEEAAQPPETRDLVKMIRESAEKGANIVKSLLTFVRGGEGQRKRVQLQPVINEVREIVRKTFPRSIKLDGEIAEGLPLVEADTTQVHQVLLNLCINARDAMRKGGTLSISARSDSQEGLVIEVGDTGTGIPPEILDKIFDPFFTTKEPGMGTGLGLSTAVGIIKNHGGILTVDSQIGKGTVFRILLPASER